MELSFEQEMKAYLSSNNISFLDSTESFKNLDFTLVDNIGKLVITYDVKEKLKKYTPSNWPTEIPESFLFILDDLAVRKCLAHAPRSGIFIRDYLSKNIFFFSIIDLALMPKKRVNRSINKNQPALKGKWLIDLRNGKQFNNVDEAISFINKYLGELKEALFTTLPCYGTYVNEKIDCGGIERRLNHWEEDIKNTR